MEFVETKHLKGVTNWEYYSEYVPELITVFWGIIALIMVEIILLVGLYLIRNNKVAKDTDMLSVNIVLIVLTTMMLLLFTVGFFWGADETRFDSYYEGYYEAKGNIERISEEGSLYYEDRGEYFEVELEDGTEFTLSKGDLKGYEVGDTITLRTEEDIYQKPKLKYEGSDRELNVVE